MSSEHLYDSETGASYGNHKSYIKGFILSIVITTIAFLIVGYKVFSPIGINISVILLALIQLFVQLVFFLHLSTNSKARWNLVSAVFAIIIVVIILAGTLWIMFNLYAMMM